MANLQHAFRRIAPAVPLLAFVCPSHAQQPSLYGLPNQWNVAAEYSNNSSRIVVGESGQRKWAALSFGYARRVLAGRGMSLAYLAEIRPLAFESDPVTQLRFDATGVLDYPVPPNTSYSDRSCMPLPDSTETIGNGTDTKTIVETTTCSRRWTYGGAVSPAGFRVNARATRALQPYLLGTLGGLATTRPIPAKDGTRLNFLIQLGAGFQLYRTPSRSVFAEYRIQHISNDDRSSINPGIDSQVVRIGLQFGR